MIYNDTYKNLLDNNRFYIIIFSLLIGVFVVCLLRIQITSDQAYYIHLKQAFGFLAIAFLYMSLIISPIQKIIGMPEWMENLIFARRAIGASAAYFALLHAGVSFWGELGGFDELALLPDKFIWPLIFGAVALAILCLLACASTDRVIIFLGYHRWKQVQRLVYAAGVLTTLHVWTIGVHFVPGAVRNICLMALIVLFGLESWRVVSFVVERYHLGNRVKYFLFICLWFTCMLLLGWLTFSRSAEAHTLIKDSVTGVGAVLHITPDDDPIAGERTSFLLDIQGSLTKEKTTASLTIVDDQQRKTDIQAYVQGNAIKADYIFPKQGQYTLTISAQQGSKQTHSYTAGLRISRGAINDVTAHGTPLWAEVGLLCTVIMAGFVAATAFSRRRPIIIYSKL